MAEDHYQDAPGFLREFLFYLLTVKGCSVRTVDAYYIDLRTFLRYLKCSKMTGEFPEDLSDVAISDIPVSVIQAVTLSDVYEYLNYTLTGRENSAKTRSRKVSSLRSFFRYLHIKTTLLPTNPVENLEVPSVRKSLPKYLTLEQSLELLAGSMEPGSERDYAMLTLFLNCGMRLSELVGINLGDFNTKEHSLRLLGKGNKERIVYLNDACIAAVERYLAVRPRPKRTPKDQNALFLSRTGSRISPRRVEQIITACLGRIGLQGQGYSVHKLRHTAATLMYQHGQVDIRVLQDILGHANLSTTEIYTHIAERQVEEAMKNSPLAKVKAKKTPQP